MCRKILYLLILVITCYISLPQVTKAVTITDTIRASMDNTLYEDPTGSSSNGLGTHFFAGKTASGIIRRGLILFKVENRIPIDAVITSVRLRLNMSKTPTDSGIRRFELHRALKPWGEGASTAFGEEGYGAPSEPNDATWIHNFYASLFWTNPGGDFDTTISGSTNVGPLGFYEWSSMGMINDVRKWLNDSLSNYGWFLIGNELSNLTAKRFDTKDHPNLNLRPKLIVTYTTNSVGLSLSALTEGYWHGTDGGFVLPDTLTVYLRSATSPYPIVDTAKIYHRSVSNLVFSADSGSYYIVVNHRNSIETWSKLPVTFVPGYTTSYSFTSAATQAYGDNLVLEAGQYSIYSGDVNKDGFINLLDIVLNYNDGTNFVNGYVQTDVNGDNTVNLVDLLIIANNSNKFIKVERPL